MTTLLRREHPEERALSAQKERVVKDAMRTKQDEIAARLLALEIEADLWTHSIPKD